MKLHCLIARPVQLMILIALAATISRSQNNFIVISPGDSPSTILMKAAAVRPSPRQLAWQSLEFIAFAHFGMNTYMDQEWGKGTEDPAMFNPTDFDARQWVRVIKDAGMKMLIITAKHHDGFCLWPSNYTTHSVARSPWKNGKGDVVGELSNACREAGLKFGVYLSPWDRHEPTYGDSPVYNEHFRNQLRELLTNYGDIAEVWFDGANGEGPNGKKQIYDWQSYYKLIRELQPNAVIAIMGPDVRWVGTESGYGRETEWSVVPDIVQNLGSTASGSQQDVVDGGFAPRDLMMDDLGSRPKIMHARTLLWYPAETDVSIRPGWFYHAEQDNLVKSPAKLVDIYCSSVGRNSLLLLNIPPDKRGKISDSDIEALRGMRTILDQTFKTNLAAGATILASSDQPGHPAASVTEKSSNRYWIAAEGALSALLEVRMPEVRIFDRLVLQEELRVGQRIESFRLESWDGTHWKTVTHGTTVGYKRLLRFPPVASKRVRLVIDSSRATPTLATFGLYKSPPTVTIEPGGGSFETSTQVQLATETRDASIYYTLDGSQPTFQSLRYSGPIELTRSAQIKAAASYNGELCAEISEAQFTKCFKVQKLSLEKQANVKYSAIGPSILIDGQRGSLDFQDKKWIGFLGDDVVAVLDLGFARDIHSIIAGFLQQQGSWIFLPDEVQFSVSDDGDRWVEVGARKNSLSRTESVVVKDYTCPVKDVRARFVKISAKNIGVCPPWHAGAGEKAWLFVDEIMVE